MVINIKELTISFDVLPPSVNQYLKPRIGYVGDDMPYSYMEETEQSRKFKKAYRIAAQRAIKQQGWDKNVTAYGHWYLDCEFVLQATNQDNHNFYKILMDALEGYAYLNDKNIEPRTQRISYNSKNPRFTVHLRMTDYVGLFDSIDEAKAFKEQCRPCRFYRDGKCSVLRKCLEARENKDFKDHKCLKRVEKKK